jgi:adenylate cyclase
MAFWNAPRTDEDHAYSACLAAMEVQSGLRERAAAWEAQGLPAVNTRIGLNTGICIVGNVGDASRMSYTALGDAVNLASRLESLNKYYGTRLLIGEETLIRLKGRIPSRPVDRVAVKGRTEPTLISELFPQKEPWHDDYALAWDAYRAEKWQEACKLFLSVVKAHPDDGPSLLLARRCKKFATEGVPADWTGTWIMNSK